MNRNDFPRPVRIALALAVLGPMAACDSFDPVWVDGLNMEPDSVFLEPGESAQITAIPVSSQGDELMDRRDRVEFSVSQNSTSVFSADPAAGTITVTAIAVGSAPVTGRLGRGQNQTLVHVVPPGLESVSMSHSSLDLQQGQSVLVRAVLLDAQGNPVSHTGHRLSWRAGDTNIANVYIINRDLPETTVRGLRVGNTTVMLIVSGRTVSIPVRVR